MIALTEDTWEFNYHPITNPNNPLGPLNGTLFETYGEDLAFVKQAPEDTVWTWVSGNDFDVIVSGYHYVNRMGYFITEVPFSGDETIEIDISMNSEEDVD